MKIESSVNEQTVTYLQCINQTRRILFPAFLIQLELKHYAKEIEIFYQYNTTSWSGYKMLRYWYYKAIAMKEFTP